MELKMNTWMKFNKSDQKMFQKVKEEKEKMTLPQDLFNKLATSKNTANDY